MRLRELIHALGNRLGVHEARLQLLKQKFEEENITDNEEYFKALQMSFNRTLEVFQHLRLSTKEANDHNPLTVDELLTRLNIIESKRLYQDYDIRLVLAHNASLNTKLSINLNEVAEITEYIASLASKAGADTIFFHISEVNGLIYLSYSDNGEGMTEDEKELLSVGVTEFGETSSLSIIRSLAQEAGGYMKDIQSSKGLGTKYSFVYRKVG